MTSGPIMVQVLEGEDAIARYRELMGKTNPEEAACGTIRADYALSMRHNSVHGSDSQNQQLVKSSSFSQSQRFALANLVLI